jgi:PAS domain-containing protein
MKGGEQLLEKRTMAKKAYAAPMLTKYSSIDEMPEHLLSQLSDAFSCKSKLNAVYDLNRRYRSISTMFANLLGYESEELRGKRIDDVTVTEAINVELAFSDFVKLGEMCGLWLFKDRGGQNKLCRYSARYITDQLIFAEFEPLQLAL